MPWVRIHDAALSHPKILGMFDPRDPFNLWVWGLSYVQQHLTDGFIPTEALPKRASKVVIDRLIGLAVWDRIDRGYQVHDYLDWNDSKAVVLTKRLEAKARMQAARDRRSAERSRERSSLERSTPERSQNVLRGVVEKKVPPEKESEEKPDGRSKHPVFKGRSIVVFDWMLAELMAMLGRHTNDFALDEWFYTLDDMALRETVVVNNRWKWIQAKTLEEARKRGLPMAGEHEEWQPPMAWQCSKCGEIHEGTAAQAAAWLCLKTANTH